MSKHTVPFEKTVRAYMLAHNVEESTALERIQSHYEKLKQKNDERIQKQLDSLNEVQVRTISHAATLSTLILTASGILISQSGTNMENPQIIIIMIIIVSQSLSLLLGGIDFVQTTRFHREWLKLYTNIDSRVFDEISNGRMQHTSQIGEIEQDELDGAPESTRECITNAMLVTCAIGLILLPFLFFTFFNNLPQAQ